MPRFEPGWSWSVIQHTNARPRRRPLWVPIPIEWPLGVRVLPLPWLKDWSLSRPILRVAYLVSDEDVTKEQNPTIIKYYGRIQIPNLFVNINVIIIDYSYEVRYLRPFIWRYFVQTKWAIFSIQAVNSILFLVGKVVISEWSLDRSCHNQEENI